MSESKYDKAVTRARDKAAGTDLQPQQPAAMPVIVGGDLTGMVVPTDTVLAELGAKVADGSWEAAPQLLTLKEGQTIIAELEGNGPQAEFVDSDTGEVSQNDTWILSKNGIRVSILSSAQLDRKLPPFTGGLVSITRGKDVRNGQRLFTEYLVIGPKRTDGTRRDWATKPRAQLAAPAQPEAAATKAEDLLDTPKAS